MQVDLPCGIFNVRYRQDTAILRTKAHWALFAIFLGFIYIIPPAVFSEYMLGIINGITITIISVYGLNIVKGYCGQINLGQAAFMAIGAYTCAICSAQWNLPFLICLPLSGISAALAGFIFALPAVRVKGFYLALATLAAQFIIMYVIEIPAAPLTGGVYSIEVDRPRIGSFVFDSEQKVYFLILTVTIIMIYFATNIARSKIGRNFIATRDNDLAAEVMGINIFRYKLLAFTICSFYAGISGSLLSYYTGVITTDYFPLHDSIWQVGMIIIGGMGSAVGPIFGTIFVRGLMEGISSITPTLVQHFPQLGEGAFSSFGEFSFALAIAFFLIYEPRGIAHRWGIFKSFYRHWPFSY